MDLAVRKALLVSNERPETYLKRRWPASSLPINSHPFPTRGRIKGSKPLREFEFPHRGTSQHLWARWTAVCKINCVVVTTWVLPAPFKARGQVHVPPVPVWRHGTGRVELTCLTLKQVRRLATCCGCVFRCRHDMPYQLPWSKAVKGLSQMPWYRDGKSRDLPKTFAD